MSIRAVRALGARVSQLRWWQGMLLFWVSVNALAILAVMAVVAMAAPAMAAPRACTQSPCVLQSQRGSEFEWLGWYAQSQQFDLVVPGPQARLVKASFGFSTAKADCADMCAVVAGLALQAGNLKVSPNATFCMCRMGSLAADRWAIWANMMPASWIRAMRTGRPFHWPLQPGEGA